MIIQIENSSRSQTIKMSGSLPIKNIIVVGYPKSGTTYATRLISQLVGCPSVGYWGFEGNTFATEGQDRISEFQCFQSHHLYQQLLNSPFGSFEKVIYISRDPRDIVVSGAFHFRFYHPAISKLSLKYGSDPLIIKALKFISHRMSTKKGRIEQMIRMLRNGSKYIPHCQHAWNSHVRSFEDSSILKIRYEDLLSKPLDSADLILNYVGVGKSPSQIITDFEMQSFASRKSEFLEAKEAIKSKHLRRGVSGDWKNHLSDRQLRQIIDYLGEEMAIFNYL